MHTALWIIPLFFCLSSESARQLRWKPCALKVDEWVLGVTIPLSYSGWTWKGLKTGHVITVVVNNVLTLYRL